MPVLLGIATLLVAYRVGSRVMGRRAGLVFLAFVCLSDILAFVNSRGDFSESLSVPLTIGLVCLIGRPNRSILRGVLCLGLLMTGLGKGMFVVGLMVVAQLTVAAMMPGHRRSYAREIAITLAVAFVPTILYLWIASLWFSSAGIIHHDAVAATGICDLINKLVIHYAQTKAHVSGTALDAAMVWWDPGIWPATVLGGAVLLAGLVSVPVRLARIRFRPKSRREAVQIALAVWALAGLAVILVRGTAGARYHLMYLPALWMLAAFWLGPRIATPIGRIVALAALSLWAAAISTAVPSRMAERSTSTWPTTTCGPRRPRRGTSNWPSTTPAWKHGAPQTMRGRGSTSAKRSDDRELPRSSSAKLGGGVGSSRRATQSPSGYAHSVPTRTLHKCPHRNRRERLRLGCHAQVRTGVLSERQETGAV